MAGKEYEEAGKEIDRIVKGRERSFLAKFRQRRNEIVEDWDKAERIGTLEERLEIYDEMIADEEKRLDKKGKWDEEEVTISEIERGIRGERKD